MLRRRHGRSLRWREWPSSPPTPGRELQPFARRHAVPHQDRILTDLRVVDHADEFLGNRLPAELFNEIRSYKIGPATKIDPARLRAIENREDLSPFLCKTEPALQQLHAYVNALNKDYWPAIADADEYRKRQPMYEPELPITEALSKTHDAWVETPGALELWQELCRSWDAEASSDPWVDVD